VQNPQSADSIRAIVYEVVMEPEWMPSWALIRQRLEENNPLNLGGSVKWQIGAMVLTLLDPDRHDPTASRLLMLPDVAGALNPIADEVRQRLEMAARDVVSCGELQHSL
jgi:hypothetical protein